MIVKYVLWGLVTITAALFLTIFAVSGNYTLAALAVGLGGIWLATEAKGTGRLGTVLFLAFVVVALVACLDDAPMPLTVLGLSVDLAAWDVSRFRARFAREIARDAHATVEARHLRLLAVTVSVGFLVALLPLFVRLTIPFIAICAVTLLALLTLRQSMRSLRTNLG